ncbi:MAG: biotin--[acetyl-CoA-carboxylase] ligase [Proteobacteria bacterium]|nr:biotin--[acetyl-CoA-carboxylase] ligase [Pseudomonadota bacterium]
MTWFTASNPPPEPHLPSGWRTMEFDELDSTNAALKRITEQGGEVAEGLLVWAKSQTGGRGRAGRAWQSPPGNVYASFLIKAPDATRHAPEIGFVGALAVRDAILELPRHNTAPPAVAFKWPNDVLIAGKKVCGMLPELATDPDGRQWIVLGIGINLIPVDVPEALYPVGSLADSHVDTKPAHVLTMLGRSLSAWLDTWRTDGFGAIREAWRAYGPQSGAPLSVRLPEGPVSGTFAGLDDDGALLLETSTGRRKLVVGDVMFGEV